jgi:ABC-type dipeptide/oligopeptide/nickel transport system permease subunit
MIGNIITKLGVPVRIARHGVREDSQLDRIISRFTDNKLGIVGLVLMTGYLLVSILGPLFITKDPSSMNPDVRYQAPTAVYPFGTDGFGRDVFARVISGARKSLRVALATILIAGGLGVSLGLMAGYFRGKVDSAIMRIVDILLAFPSILLALVVVSILGPGLNKAILALGVAFTPSMIRITRASSLSIRETEYVLAAKAYGESSIGIMFREMLPNVASAVIVQGTLVFAWAILAEASLSFLGLSAQPPTSTWGVMVAEGQNNFMIAPWATLFPGLAIVLTVLGLTFFGVGLRDALDPHTDVDTTGGNV